MIAGEFTWTGDAHVQLFGTDLSETEWTPNELEEALNTIFTEDSTGYPEPPEDDGDGSDEDGGSSGSEWNPGDSESHWADDFAWGLLQGGANVANGVQDVVIGTANIPALLGNGVANTVDWLLGTPEDHRIRIPYIPSRDWSNGVVIEESGFSHGLSKFAGGTGVAILVGRIPGGLRLPGRAVAPSRVAGSVGNVGIADDAIRGQIGFVERVSLQLQARLKFGAKPSIAFGKAKDRFVRGSNTIELTGSRFGKHSRGTFFEELQHAIDDAVGVNPGRFPSPGTLENAQFHLEVFERLIDNPIFKLNPVERLNLIRKTKELITSLGG